MKRFKDEDLDELIAIYKKHYPNEPITRDEAEEMGARLVRLYRLFRTKPANMSEKEFKLHLGAKEALPHSKAPTAYSGHSDHPFRFYSITGSA